MGLRHKGFLRFPTSLIIYPPPFPKVIITFHVVFSVLLGIQRWIKDGLIKEHGLPWWLSGEESASNTGNLGSISRLGRLPSKGCKELDTAE